MFQVCSLLQTCEQQLDRSGGHAHNVVQVSGENPSGPYYNYLYGEADRLV
jgi:hypothetical protein